MSEQFVSSHRAKLLTRLIQLSLIILVACHFAVKGQSCPTSGSGSHTIWAGISANGSSLASKAVVPVGTTLRIDAVVTTSGGCDTACAFFPNLVNHIAVTADISTNGSLNGNYTIGYVFGLNPNGSTGYFATLNTEASNSTGPVFFTPSVPGTYFFHIQGIIDRHPNCSNISDETDIVDIVINVGDADDATSLGDDSCPNQGDTTNSGVASATGVGKPINVTNGNMYLEQTDYRLPGIGAGLTISRTHNSRKQLAGWFGFGWSSILDESVVSYGNLLLGLNLADGRAVYLSRPDTSTPYTAAQPLSFRGQVVKNANNTYTLTFKDSRSSIQHQRQAGFICRS